MYAILDGASVDGLLDQLDKYQPESVCLYRGELDPDLAEVAPYLVRLDDKSAFTDWLLEQGWDKRRGVFAVSRADLPAMRRHFRAFLTVHDSEGKPLLFRYYDPRVLRAYLPTCTSPELAAFFGPVILYLSEAEKPGELLRFQLSGGALKSSTKHLREEA